MFRTPCALDLNVANFFNSLSIQRVLEVISLKYKSGAEARVGNKVLVFSRLQNWLKFVLDLKIFLLKISSFSSDGLI